MTDAKFNALLDLGIFITGIIFMAVMYHRSPAWREAIQELFWWKK